ncbi:MAG: hypothetical protein HY072_08755, partial [Deltaproteobacteria bacterium]|nr:hypothetical protein [Deltaproteobacteria bacterium]
MKYIKTCILCFIFLCILNFQIHAEVPTQFEAEYSEAVLAYNAKDFKKSLQILEALEQKAPEITEVLELQALSSKALQDDKQVEATYAKIIKLKTKQNRPEKEFAPYHFELGLIRHKEHKQELAAKHFRFALKNGFNEAVCHLYLGMYSFQSGAWANSEHHFDGIISSG